MIFLHFPKPLIAGQFLGRPQRFLVEVRLHDGSQTIAYCSNPGSFNGCLCKGAPVLLWKSPDLGRKRELTWRAIQLGNTWIGTDTHLANAIVKKALLHEKLPMLKGFSIRESEPRCKNGKRLDFVLSNKKQNCYLEVKNAVVSSGGYARFPDSQSPRAIAHLNNLTKYAKNGNRSVLLFVIQRNDISGFKFNYDKNPRFSRSVELARKSGVEFYAIKHSVSTKGFGEPVEVPIFTKL